MYQKFDHDFLTESKITPDHTFLKNSILRRNFIFILFWVPYNITYIGIAVHRYFGLITLNFVILHYEYNIILY